MKVNVLFGLVFFFITCLNTLYAACQANNQANVPIKISFINTINNIPVVLDSGNYTNCWNETFNINALKYYISNVQLQTAEKKIAAEKNSYHLINEEDSASKNFSFTASPGIYKTLSFLIGIDSLMNVSGAQTNALDPLNGMFWTWNSGYIMFKLEGYSAGSAVIKNKIEYHIGGFSGANNVLRRVELNIENSAVLLDKNSTTEIIVHTDLSKIWNAVHELKISKTPICTTPGILAAGIADNYSKAFEILKVIHP